MDEALVVAMLFLFLFGHAVKILERNYDEILTSIEEELERQAMDNYEAVKELASLQLQGLPCVEEDECRALEGKEVATKTQTDDECV